jgi:sugar lactone lactonase YvrE
VVLALASVLGLSLAATPASALNTHVFSTAFGSAGAGAGQLSLASSSGVAVNTTTHDVYVADTGNLRVDQFSSAGVFIRAWGWGVADGLPGFESCTLACQPGLAGSGAGQFTTPAFVAVDNSAGPSAGDVYVGDAGTNTVLKFSASGAYLATNDGSSATAPVAGPFGPLGGVTVDGSGNLWVYDQNGNMFEFAQGGGFTTDWNSGRGVIPNGIDADSAGNLYVLTGAGTVEQFTATGTDVGPVNGDATDPTGFALDRSSGEVYMDSGGVLVRHYPAGCDAGGSCTAVDTFGSGHLSGAAGLAVDPSSQTVYAVDTGAGQLSVFIAATLPDVTTSPVTGVTASSAVFNGHLDPAGGGDVTSCRFEYVTDAAFQATGFSDLSSGGSVACDQGTPISSPSDVTATATALSPTPFTVYHVRLVASNALGASSGADQSFTTPGPPAVDSTGVTNVTSDSADLGAQINPGLLSTTYHFQYGTSSSYGQSTPESPSIGADFTDHPASAHIQGLAPGTTYHFRVVASNSLAPGGIQGPDHTLTTQASAGGTPTLPDNRGYELVTPVNKGDGNLPAPARGGTSQLGSPNAIQASTSGDRMAFSTLTPFSGAQTGTYGHWLASRNPGGWSTQALDPPQAHGGSPYVTAFSADLSRLLMLDGVPFVTIAGGQDDPPLVAGEPANTQNLFLRDNTLGSYQLMDALPPGSSLPDVGYEGASPDLSHVVFTTSGNAGRYYSEGVVLEWSGGVVSPVSEIPSGSATSCGGGGPSCIAGGTADIGAGTFFPPLNAVSSDGSKVFFQLQGTGQQDVQGVGALYVREGGTRTVEISGGGAHYLTATPDGSEVFFGFGGDLYRYDTNTGVQTALTVDSHGDPNGADVQGVLGASADGSYVYFVANGVLASGASLGNVVGPYNGPDPQLSDSSNLYVAHNGTTTFMGRVGAADFSDWSGNVDGFTARVTPDGRHVAFDSARSLTGYDNRDAVTGQPDSEVYLYDASTNQLACASCNPSGAQPTDNVSIQAINATGNSPGWDGGQLYLSRNLSDDGSRLFFETTDALAAGDVNGMQDVYEYEHGRPYLISSGTSDVDSSFFDATPSGSDVFFETASQLAAQDTDQKLDIYDARVGGGFPPVPPVGVPCSGDLCKPPPSGSPPGIAPGSSTFIGSGNPAVVGGARAAGPKALTRAQLLARALKACGRKPRRQRAACRAHARKLHGPRKATRARKSAPRTAGRTGK